MRQSHRYVWVTQGSFCHPEYVIFMQSDQLGIQGPLIIYQYLTMEDTNISSHVYVRKCILSHWINVFKNIYGKGGYWWFLNVYS